MELFGDAALAYVQNLESMVQTHAYPIYHHIKESFLQQFLNGDWPLGTVLCPSRFQYFNIDLVYIAIEKVWEEFDEETKKALVKIEVQETITGEYLVQSITTKYRSLTHSGYTF